MGLYDSQPNANQFFSFNVLKVNPENKKLDVLFKKVDKKTRLFIY